MLRLSLFVGAFFLLPLGCSKQDTVVSLGVPKSVEIAECGFEEGLIQLSDFPFSNKPKSVSVAAVNRSGKNVRIQSIVSSCGCTKIAIADSEIPANSVINIECYLDCRTPGPRSTQLCMLIEGRSFASYCKLSWSVVPPIRFEISEVHFPKGTNKLTIPISKEPGINLVDFGFESMPGDAIAANWVDEGLEISIRPEMTSLQSGVLRVIHSGAIVEQFPVSWERLDEFMIAPPTLRLIENQKDYILFVDGEEIKEVSLKVATPSLEFHAGQKSSKGCLIKLRIVDLNSLPEKAEFKVVKTDGESSIVSLLLTKGDAL
ncbi:hypothetical protein SH449x_004202 [Pirellulaceae bacterium SH449]